MAYAINTDYTLAEALRQKAPDGSFMPYIDVLSEADAPLFEEGYWIEANDDTSHEFVQTVTEPSGNLVRLNEGAPYEVGTTKPVIEQLARMESNMFIDKRILERSPDPVRYRRERESMYVRGMKKSVARRLFGSGTYGSQDLDVRDINGLSRRYPALVADSVVGNGATGSGTLGSIWIARHGLEWLFCLYPKTASKALQVNDHGEQKKLDANNYPYWGFETNFAWEFGMGIGDPRNVKRLCNIAPSGNNSFWADGTNAAKGEEALIDLLEAMPGGDLNGLVMYACPKLIAQFRKRANSKGSYFDFQDIWNRKMLSFQGVPVVRVESLSMNESTIS
jgi:hypothetical protein